MDLIIKLTNDDEFILLDITRLYNGRKLHNYNTLVDIQEFLDLQRLFCGQITNVDINNMREANTEIFMCFNTDRSEIVAGIDVCGNSSTIYFNENDIEIISAALASHKPS